MLFENIKLAFSAMRGSKMRTALSLLGIVIGVASVVAILTIGQSASQSITESIAVGGLDMITIYPSYGQRTTGTFTEEFSDMLIRDVEGLQTVLPQNNSSARVRYGKESMNASVSGVLSDYGNVLNLEYAEGSFFSDMDNINRRQVVVLGSSVAETLFPEQEALGQYVSLFRNQAKSYLVVGVLEAKDATFNLSYDNTVFIPYNTYGQRFLRTSGVGAYVIKVMDGYDTIEVSDRVTEYLDDIVGTDGYNLFSPASLAEMANQITGTFSAFLAAIAAISLLVGGIGIMNIMLVSVAERTKEIGIRKALGASPSVIRGQFIVEALTLTILGGLLGVALGSLLSYAVTNLMDWSLHLSYASFILAMGFSMFVGVFFGWYPAMKASRLDPIDALNYE
ncbi:MAG: ABC transporter permease [Sphaerochaeta sp.]|jgi:ABC-type antimicrobial peptide transport system permease subunit|uniref:Macrolide export ATP-binding/permease protein MacB n=1 Tax=bioreactor metagenome TaxID=1076179 RepID=A0A644WIE2_9ZZZZ|nr:MULTISPECIES: ABC transporter permease [Sphaerochaeta]MDD4037135.1 ABC transporter permease [Sphaerochaeta sp.]MDD4449353.1 ABC transporter permease [Sphaerochaeta sp.]MDX9984324.1 ABC transporter permease [Sphaerochaeta sp.]MEA5106959.1 ABC transporter permease [Sphaerochaeta associata]